MNNDHLIETFYNAFVAGDAQGMTACYHDDVIFSDPAFGTIEGDRAKAMWHMLIERGKGLNKVTYEVKETSDTKGTASWTAHYPYGPKQRPVVNHVTAQFIFQEGKIKEHHDNFDMYKWSKQALGLPGVLLGWSKFMRNAIQKRTNEMLSKYMQR